MECIRIFSVRTERLTIGTGTFKLQKKVEDKEEGLEEEKGMLSEVFEVEHEVLSYTKRSGVDPCQIDFFYSSVSKVEIHS